MNQYAPLASAAFNYFPLLLFQCFSKIDIIERSSLPSFINILKPLSPRTTSSVNILWGCKRSKCDVSFMISSRLQRRHTRKAFGSLFFDKALPGAHTQIVRTTKSLFKWYGFIFIRGSLHYLLHDNTNLLADISLPRRWKHANTLLCIFTNVHYSVWKGNKSKDKLHPEDGRGESLGDGSCDMW